MAFGCDGWIYGLDEDDYDGFTAALQKVLADGEATLITEAGHEKLRYVSASCVVITKDAVDYINLPDAAMTMARELLGNKDFNTKMDY